MSTFLHKRSTNRSAIEQRYNSAAWNTEGLLKDFLSKWHGKALSLETFEAQEADIEIEDRFYQEFLLDDKLDRNGRPITSFNSDFFGLFKEFLLTPSGSDEEFKYRPNKDLLWCGILEVETEEVRERHRAQQDAGLEQEKINYSLFCFAHNQKNPPEFFAAHRKYEDIEHQLIGLTHFFLDDPDLNARSAFDPWCIRVRPRETIISGSSDRLSRIMSYELFLDEELVRKVDDKIRTYDLQRLTKDIDNSLLLDVFAETCDSVLAGKEREFIRCGVVPMGSEVLWNKFFDKKFIYYLLWLRSLGIAGGANNNWADYYYFRVPDLSGYLHAVTIASKTPLDPALFHLIDRNAPTLFQRSLLRLAVKEKELRKDVQSHARRAAVVAVMARNMSHNVGSHVLARLSTPKQLSSQDTGTGSDSKTLSQIATLNSYLQTRMDFLADLATSIPLVALPKRLYRDLLVYFRPNESENLRVDWQRLLMDRISGSTNIRADKIKIAVKLLKDRSEKRLDLNTLDADPVFASPNDMLGAHALYVIFENVIRNCAKHSHITSQSTLKLNVTVGEFNQDLWRLTVSDNLGECRAKPHLVSDLEVKIDRSILEPDGSLRRGGWGMLEMKIAAAYLRRIAPSYIDDEQTPRLLTPVSKDGNLGYELYLSKPKIALIIDSAGKLSTLRDELKSFGIDVLGNFDELNRPADHEFLILDESERHCEFLSKSSEAFPARILFISNAQLVKDDHIASGEFVRQLESRDIQSIRNYFWNKRVSGHHSSELPTIKKCHCSPGSEARVEVLMEGSDGAKECIFFDNHGECYGVVNPDHILYYEPYKSKSPTGLILNYLPSTGPQKDTILCELIEAARLGIAIVDERVQSESQKNCSDYPLIEKHHHKVVDILRWMNIVVLGPAIVDLNKEHLDSQDREALERELENLSRSREFLVIHLGVIERMLGTTDDTKISNWVTKWKRKFRGFVITSGRGRPSNLPSDARFLHYSLISRYVFDERSKYHLCKVLYASRSIPR